MNHDRKTKLNNILWYLACIALLACGYELFGGIGVVLGLALIILR